MGRSGQSNSGPRLLKLEEPSERFQHRVSEIPGQDKRDADAEHQACDREDDQDHPAPGLGRLHAGSKIVSHLGNLYQGTEPPLGSNPD